MPQTPTRSVYASLRRSALPLVGGGHILGTPLEMVVLIPTSNRRCALSGREELKRGLPPPPGWNPENLKNGDVIFDKPRH